MNTSYYFKQFVFVQVLNQPFHFSTQSHQEHNDLHWDTYRVTFQWWLGVIPSWPPRHGAANPPRYLEDTTLPESPLPPLLRNTSSWCEGHPQIWAEKGEKISYTSLHVFCCWKTSMYFFNARVLQIAVWCAEYLEQQPSILFRSKQNFSEKKKTVQYCSQTVAWIWTGVMSSLAKLRV